MQAKPKDDQRGPWTIKVSDEVSVIKSYHGKDPEGRKQYSYNPKLSRLGLGAKDLPLYKSEGLENLHSNSEVWFVEGETNAEALTQQNQTAVSGYWGAAQNTFGESLQVLTPYCVILWPDNDEAGRKYMARIGRELLGICKDVNVVDVESLTLPPKGDVVDFLDAGGDMAEVKTIPFRKWDISDAPLPVDIPRQIPSGQEPPMNPANKPLVDGLAMYDQTKVLIDRYNLLPEGANTVLALWFIHTYCLDLKKENGKFLLEYVPFLYVNSVTKQSGKTNLMELSSELVKNAMMVSTVSAATITRGVDKNKWTLLIDETDQFSKDHLLALNPILNSSFKRKGQSARWDMDARSEEILHHFCPIMLSGIKTKSNLHETTLDRAIHINMKRAYFEEQEELESFRNGDIEDEAEELREKYFDWVEQKTPQFAKLDPVDFPRRLRMQGRQKDIWEPIIWIGQILGGHAEEEAWGALKLLYKQGEDSTLGYEVKLLGDIIDCYKDSEFATQNFYPTECIIRDFKNQPDLGYSSYLESQDITKPLKDLGLKSTRDRVDIMNHHTGQMEPGKQKRGFVMDLLIREHERYKEPDIGD
tara:strand:+ start:148 stop:1908 length:1761 start_codon:yes stop_codon:yes gene_type:complete